MDRKYKAYLKLNLVSLFFMAVSFISVTLAWFAYSGISSVHTDIDVKTWFIEFEKNDEVVSNDIVISLSEIYPGMETVHESFKIKNKGDSNAQLDYSILSARILDKELDVENLGMDNLRDKLSHDYPFGININLSKDFILSKGDESVFDISVSWPLDSKNDKRDSDWGNLAYQFGVSEQENLDKDPNYKVRSSIKIVLSVNAQQAVSDNESEYALGDLVLYDPVNDVSCEQLQGSCIITHAIDTFTSEDGDDYVVLLPYLFGSYSSGIFNNYNILFNSINDTWNVNTRTFNFDDALKIISTDVVNSVIVREEFSDAIIGYVNSDDRINSIIDETILHDGTFINGYFSFLNEKFDYLTTSKCYWLNKAFDENYSFALTKISDSKSKIYLEDNSAECSVVPLIIVSKDSI